MAKDWQQPRLDGGVLRHFHITADFRWPSGWSAACWIAQEEAFRREPIEVSRLNEANTQQLDEWLAKIALMLRQMD